jgi:hypothetical protein
MLKPGVYSLAWSCRGEPAGSISIIAQADGVRLLSIGSRSSGSASMSSCPSATPRPGLEAAGDCAGNHADQRRCGLAWNIGSATEPRGRAPATAGCTADEPCPNLASKRASVRRSALSTAMATPPARRQRLRGELRDQTHLRRGASHTRRSMPLPALLAFAVSKRVITHAGWVLATIVSAPLLPKRHGPR